MPTAEEILNAPNPINKVPAQPTEPAVTHEDVIAQREQDTWMFLTTLRAMNAMFLGTFFQPDEFYQSLEPAWQLAFGKDSGAWITWEWKHQLRSSIIPIFFGAIYKFAHSAATFLNVPPGVHSMILIVSPGLLQGSLAAVMDYSTWKLAERIYGRTTAASWGVLALSVLSPWQAFASVRTLSNSTEAALTVLALRYWPWQWYQPSSGASINPSTSEVWALRASLIAAALASFIRPTNVIIWITLAALTLRRAYSQQVMVAIREIVLCGATVLAACVSADRWYYGVWTLTPLRFLHFNLTEDLAVFYGQNRMDYYFSEGIPLLLTMAIPFAAFGLLSSLLGLQPSKEKAAQDSTVFSPFTIAKRRDLAIVAVILPAVLSFVSHKEVRFIYPILPILLVLSGSSFARLFGDVMHPERVFKKILLGVYVFLTSIIILYTVFNHQRGVMDVATFLRWDYERVHLGIDRGNITAVQVAPMTVGFLMPCHSTPWRSKLIYPGIEAWALTCEPPIDLPIEARSTYLDEADQFYADPQKWIRKNLGPAPKQLLTPKYRSLSAGPFEQYPRSAGQDGVPGKREWPQRLVYFEQLNSTMDKVLAGSKYEPCMRIFNTRWHDDWRREGAVVVQCLDYKLD